jgi:hypothetical protein
LFQVASGAIFAAQIGLKELTAGPTPTSVPPKVASSQAALTTAPPANSSQAAPANGTRTPSQTTNSTLFARFVAALGQLNLDPGTLNFLKSLGRMLEQVDPQAFGQLIQGLELLAQSLASQNNGNTSPVANQRSASTQELNARTPELTGEHATVQPRKATPVAK